ncbi:MAG: hypothetical protein AAFV95_02035 [Bacteroidota bacterium]
MILRALLLSSCLHLFLPMALQAQVPMSQESVSPYVHHFTHQNGQIKGSGAALLQQHLANSQFFVMGEYHGSQQIIQLTQTLLQEAHQYSYECFAVEVGPHSARILRRLSQDPAQTSQRLHEFNSRYYLSADDDIPIPFFDSKEEAAMLEQSRRLGMDLWGLDQEYFTASFHLFDEIASMTANDPQTQNLRKQVKPILQRLYLKDAQERRYPLYDSLAQNPSIQAFFSAAQKANPQCTAIVEDLKISWDIYNRNRLRSRSSHTKRISYMRENFVKNYQQLKNPLAKVFVKLGGLHTGKDKQLNAYDVGHLTEQLAQKNGTRSTNLGISSRFYQEEGETYDSWEDRKDKDIAFGFEMYGQKDQWTVIDLKSIKANVEAGQLSLPADYSFHGILSDLKNFDLLLIPPMDKSTEPNYQKPSDK